MVVKISMNPFSGAVRGGQDTVPGIAGGREGGREGGGKR